MSKQANKKATLKDFLAKKVKKDTAQNATIDCDISSMDKTITLKKPSEDRLFEYINEIGDNTDFKLVTSANRKLIYDSCDELHSTELHEALEVKDPYDVAKILFDINDIKEIMNQFNNLLSNKNVNKEIKN